jgi:serine phosphatase RsbU (regulator of sigma subunit)
MAEIDCAEESVQLGPGDALVLYTDGITERRNGDAFFADEFLAAIAGGAGRSARELAQHIEDAAVAFSDAVADDDMAVVVLSVPVLVPLVPVAVGAPHLNGHPEPAVRPEVAPSG